MSEPKSIFNIDFEPNILVAPGVTRKRYAHELIECACCGACTYGNSQICTQCINELYGYTEVDEINDNQKYGRDDTDYTDQ